jgi:hypothetical protein
LRRRVHHALSLLAASLTLTTLEPAASASVFKRPSFLNDASHNVGLTLEGPKLAERPAVEVEVRGLRHEAEKQAAKPETAKPEAVKPEVGPQVVKPEAARPAAEAVEVRGLSRGPRAPVADVIPEGVLEAVEYLVERFGVVLDVEAAFKAKSLVTAKVKAGEGGGEGAGVCASAG